MSLQKLMEIPAHFEELEINGEKYKVKELTGNEYKEYQSDLVKIVNDKPVFTTENAMTSLVYVSLFNEDGTRVYEKKDKALVGNLPQSVIQKIFDVSSKVNGLNGKKAKN